MNLILIKFVNLLRSPEIDFQPVRQHYLMYWPARLHGLAESIPGLLKCLQVRALGSLKVYKFWISAGILEQSTGAIGAE